MSTKVLNLTMLQRCTQIECSNQTNWEHKVFDRYKCLRHSSRRQSMQYFHNPDNFLKFDSESPSGQERLTNDSSESSSKQQQKLTLKIQVISSSEEEAQELKSSDQDTFLFDCEVRLNFEQDPIEWGELSKILKKLLKINPKDQRVKELIGIAMRRTQGSLSKFLETAAIIDLNKAIKSLQDYQQKVYNITQYYYQQENAWDLQQFKEKLNGFQVNDYSFLYKLQDKLESFVSKVVDSANWKANKPTYEPYFERLLDLMKIKIEFVSESRFIYPTLYRIQRRIEAAIDYKGSRRKINSIDDHLTDLLFQHYMQQLQTKSTRSGVYYVRDPKNDQRVPLSEFISSCVEYFKGISSWKDIFAAVARHLIVKDSAYDPKRDDAISLFIEKIPNITLPIYNCLGCAQYFYVNHNIYRPQVCKHTIALLSSISQISANASTIKDEIVALLNGKGGVLLFDCSKIYNSVIPRGTYFIETEKEEIQQRITDYLNGIYPKPQINKDIFISWVPILQDPFELKQLPKGNEYKLSQIEGLYVCRITVKPTHGHVAYYWIQEQRPIFSVRTDSLFAEGKRQLPGRSISRFIKSKFNTYMDQIKDFNQYERIVMATEVSTFNHVCRQPEKGIQMFQKKKEVNIVTTNPGETYKYASVAVAKKQDIETIRKNLLRYSVECVIVTPFESLRLKGAANSAIIYHNTRFEDLLSIVSNNKDFEFGGRYLLIISITDYVRLTERNQRNIMTEADFNSLEVWLNRQYSKEKLKMWKFITDDNDHEFYIQTDSKESSLYIYIVMTQFLERSSFKNPKGLDRMDEMEKEARFKLYYPLKK